ncbi:MAG TPA: hypothetical protein DF383_06930, partial [Deltaproteobacteria bacterium]|nr:hypothetical protein [Deltaproteobacteria bacterium]
MKQKFLLLVSILVFSLSNACGGGGSAVTDASSGGGSSGGGVSGAPGNAPGGTPIGSPVDFPGTGSGNLKFYLDADGDGFGDLNHSLETATPPSGYVVDSRDCDDQDPTVHPDSNIPENRDISNDQNCDGIYSYYSKVKIRMG